MKNIRITAILTAFLAVIIGLFLLWPEAGSAKATPSYLSSNFYELTQQGQIDIVEPAERTYYISPWKTAVTKDTEKGTEHQYYQPVIVDALPKGTNWACIDLRPNVESMPLYGYAIVAIDYDRQVNVVDIAKIADSATEILSDETKNLINNTLATEYTYPSASGDKLPDFLYSLLTSNSPNICKPIQPEADGKYRIYLGGQIYGEPPPKYTHKTLTDNFNRADQNGLGTSSQGTWSWTLYGSSDFDIVSNTAEGYDVNDSYAFANYALSSDNNYSQATMNEYWYTNAGLTARGSNSAQTYYAGIAEDYNDRWVIYKVVASSDTLLASYSTGYAWPEGDTHYFSADGSTLTYKVAGVTKVTTTDTSITTGKYCGLYYVQGDQRFYDDFEADDLAVPPSITNTPATKDFGHVNETSTYYFKGTAPSNPVVSGDCYFSITNNSGFAVNLYMCTTNATGGSGWVSTTDTPGSNQFRQTVYFVGDNPASGTVLTGTTQLVHSNLAASASIGWDGQLELGTFGDGTQRQWTLTISVQVP